MITLRLRESTFVASLIIMIPNVTIHVYTPSPHESSLIYANLQWKVNDGRDKIELTRMIHWQPWSFEGRCRRRRHLVCFSCWILHKGRWHTCIQFFLQKAEINTLIALQCCTFVHSLEEWKFCCLRHPSQFVATFDFEDIRAESLCTLLSLPSLSALDSIPQLQTVKCLDEVFRIISVIIRDVARAGECELTSRRCLRS